MTAQNVVLRSVDRAGYRLTGPRRAIAGLIAERSGHFTADDLLTASRERRLGLGRATIFRSLDLLVGLGAIERLDLPNGEHAFVGCEPEHHHHVVCSSCGQSKNVADSGLARAVSDIGSATGYRIDSHRVELFGLCPECQVAGAEQQPRAMRR